MHLTIPPSRDARTFLDFPLHTDLHTLDAHVAIIGMPHGDPYDMAGVANDQSNAPRAIRRASTGLTLGLDHWDFDLDGPLFDDREIRVVDVGDVPADPGDPGGHYRRGEAAIRQILARGALPMVLGGDHGIPIPVFRALENHGPITLVQVDAHMDWRDEVDGVREGYSSPIRRASEMAHVDAIFQLGLRAQGSARAREVMDARAYGARLISAYQIHRQGMGPILQQIPDGGNYYLTIDADGLDPAVMPAVAAPAPGGLLFHQVRELIHGLIRKGRLVGMDIVEITPSRDLNDISTITAGQLILNAIGAAVRADYFA